MPQNLTIIFRQYLRLLLGNQLKIQLPPYKLHHLAKDTDLCLEGYPRSGNSWLHRYFLKANHSAKTAHHVHLSSQIKSALNNYVPTLVLIRNPLDTIISNHIYNFCRTNLSLEIKNYICYYNYIDRIKDKILLVNFETAIYEPNYVIKCLNKKFNLSFSKGIKKDIILQMEKEYKNESQHLKYNVSHIPSERRTNLIKQLFPSIKNNLYYPIAKDIYNSLQSTAI